MTFAPARRTGMMFPVIDEDMRGKLGFVDGVFVVDGKPIPWAVDTEVKDFPSSRGSHWRARRARIRFENGWDLSIIWGSGTYSPNYDSDIHGREFIEHPTSAEVAILHSSRGIDPVGYVAASAIREFIELVCQPGVLDADNARRAIELIAGVDGND